ncbi:Xaa-Pro dipeptidyl-peptidase [Bacillus sp. H-16]|uniref:Xaa-Pro dipeptidyl-peptidase n=1 Tax=Alteribacter salitolerans TaxID=2912333 RepID=UPI001964CD99|nr:Xaa-Pro dipeptidyl-peptidase [Alteribacter salitolerans]MBM7097987.1 Xaa-Pro dipeptidyl-peptidase [Alteribacter salitolerans]
MSKKYGIGLLSCLLLLSLFIQPVSSAANDLPLNGTITETGTSSTYINFEDGVTQPVYSTEDAIIEELMVETTVDSDGTGEKDLVSIRVMRPNTEEGIQVPVIYEMSPYRAGLDWSVPFFDVDVELNPVPHPGKGRGRGPNAGPQNLGNLGNYYVPRGYAVVLGESIGSGEATGCPTTGDANEIMGTKAVIDWLNGSARAFNADGEEVAADWTTGNVGMIGASYNGTLPNGVATTGVEGLKTIVPIVTISNWYDYFRANGAVVAPGGYQGEDASVLAGFVATRDNAEICAPFLEQMAEDEDRITGDYNDFWAERNYLPGVKNIEASVLLAHGLNDWNVKTKQFAQWWEALEQHGVDRKLWLHQGGHGAPGGGWQQEQHRWFDYWLYGLENGIMDEEMVNIQREDRTWVEQENWPHVDAEATKFYLTGDNDRSGAGSLSNAPVPNRPHERQALTDDPQTRANTLVADPESDHPNRLVYTTDILQQDTHMSGTPEVSIRASIDEPVANLTVLLVEYDENDNAKIITRGWMDPQNIHGEERSISIVPGRDYTFEWDMQPHDYVFKAGNRIGVVFIASDYDYTIRPSGGTEISLLPTRSKLILPVAGGKEAFNN